MCPFVFYMELYKKDLDGYPKEKFARITYLGQRNSSPDLKDPFYVGSNMTVRDWIAFESPSAGRGRFPILLIWENLLGRQYARIDTKRTL